MFSYYYQGGHGNTDSSTQIHIKQPSIDTKATIFISYLKDNTATKHKSILPSLTIHLKILKLLHSAHLSSLCILEF